jgi:hypothetical protein
MAVGTSIIDFGTFPGSNEASVAVTGQASILSTSAAEAWLMAEAQDTHTANDAAYAALFMAVSCSIPTDAIGFTINARSLEKLQGQFKVRWVWA